MKNVLIQPRITEQSMKEARDGVFTFAVKEAAGKPEIRQAIEEAYGVHVRTVRTTHVKGKMKRVGKKRMPKYAADWKKARVRLAKGERIDAFEVSPSSA